MRLPRRDEILLMAASALLCVAAVEVAIRVGWMPLPDPIQSSAWRRERWLRTHGVSGLVTHQARIDRHDPLLGWTLLENLDGVRVGGALVHSNSQGMRGRREYPLEPGAGLRIVALGDSFTFGECVEDGESFPAQLEAAIAPGEVLNLAVHGHGHDQQLLRLRQQGLAQRPDVVLLGFLNADIERNQLWFRDYAKPRFRLRGGSLALENVPVPAPDEFAADFRLRAPGYLQMLFDVVFADRLERRNRKRTEAILNALVSEARAAGAQPALVYLPSLEQSRVGRANPSRLYRRLCAGGEVLCIDPTPRLHAFLGGEADPASHFRCHYSAALHREIAREIVAALGAAGVRPAPR